LDEKQEAHLIEENLFLQQRSQELETLFKISGLLNQQGTYKDKLNGVIKELALVAEVSGVRIVVPDPEHGGLRTIIREVGSTLPELQQVRGLSLMAFESGQAVVANDYPSHPNADPVALATGAKSVIALPIKNAEETIAVAGITSPEINHFNPDRVRLLTAIVDGLGPLLENARLDSQLLQRSEELEALFKISNIFGQPGTYEDKLSGVIEEIARVADVYGVRIIVRDPDDGGLRTMVRGQMEWEALPALQQVQGLSLMAFESGEAVLANDYSSHPNAEQMFIERGVKSSISLPIKADDKIIAVAGIASDELNHFNPERVRLLTAIVDGLGPLLENARLDQDLLDSNSQLSEALETLKATQEHLVHQERLSALGTMASGIAHDFNNALSPIFGYSEFLLEDADGFDESTVKYLQEIRTSAQDAGAVVSRLREFYRERDGSELMAPVNLNDVVARVISLTQPKWRDMALANGIDIQLITQLADDLPEISGDEAELRSALGNLVFNAVDAMPEGGTIILKTFQDGQEVILEVADTGTGMRDEVLKRAMEPFFTTKEERGTGMGLAMVYGSLQRHEGELEVESEVGKGTTFRFRIPVQTEVQNIAETLEVEPFPSGLRFLVVDDEQRVRDMVGEFLRRQGSAVETAANGREALEKFHQSEFDLVITYPGMPEMNGDALAEAIKGESPNMPIIMLTGFGEMMTSNNEKPAGVDVILGKPVTPAALRQVVTVLRAEYAARD
jgi:signal transduction histidine kinase